MLRRVGVRFLVTFTPTCAIAVGGLWLTITHRSGFWCRVGWIILIVFGIAALLQTIALIDGLARINRFQHDVEQDLEQLAPQDAKLFAQGKSFDEVRAQYKRPK
jgi:hypothetical protein